MFTNEYLLVIALYALCQMALIWLLFKFGQRLSDRFWKATDFVWFAGTLLGVVGAVERWQEQQSQLAIRYEEAAFQSTVSVAEVWADYGKSINLLNSVALSAKGKSPDSQKEVDDLLYASGAYNTLQRIFSKKLDQQSFRERFEHIQKYLDRLPQDETKVIMVGNVDAVYQHEQRLEQFKSSFDRPWVFRELDHFFPYILAIAASVRITRIVAEVFVLNRGGSWLRKAETIKEAKPESSPPRTEKPFADPSSSPTQPKDLQGG